MEFENTDWADSQISKITIEYVCAELHIFNDTFQQNMCVGFTGLIGLTNLCIRDDTVIDYADIRQAMPDEDTPFIKMLFSAYKKDLNCEERRLDNGIIEMRIRLINYTAFSVYCQKIEVEFEV